MKKVQVTLNNKQIYWMVESLIYGMKKVILDEATPSPILLF